MPPAITDLALARLSAQSFTATVAGTDPASVNSFYYRRLGDNVDTLGASRTGDGAVTVGVPVASAGYMCWAVSALADANSLPAIGFVSLAQATTLLGALAARYGLLPDLVLLAGPMYTNEIPEALDSGTPLALPYVCCTCEETVVAHAFERVKFEETRVTFDLYQAGAAKAEAAASLFDEYFNLGDVPFSDPTTFSALVQLRNTNYSVRNTMTRYTDGSLVYHARLEYEALVQKFRV